MFQDYIFIMTLSDIQNMTVSEKISVMDALWEDFRMKADQSDISETHQVLLDKRRESVQQGHAKLLDWESVKSVIGRT